jgi:NAD(P)-dependent dehydrogenase (short-subunit alcohol dehydrogenase family)
MAAWTTADIPDLRGRVAVVTGANSGLGLETARALAGHGAHVVMAVRDHAKAERARQAIEVTAPGARLELRALDLASLDSVRACAQAVLAAHPGVDLLVANAGVMGIPEQATADGFEMQFGVNHLGHFVLTHRLLPGLLRAPGARVVSVTSFARLAGRPVDPGNPHLRGAYDPWRAYNRSKRANADFALELQRRLEAAGAPVESLLAHPGLAHTDLQARGVRETQGGASQRFFHTLASTVGMTAERGALPVLRAATDPNARGGELYAPRWGTFGPAVRRRLLRRPGSAAGRALWTVSEREVGEPFDVE